MSAGSTKVTLVRPWFDSRSYVGGLFLFSSLLRELFLLCVFFLLLLLFLPASKIIAWFLDGPGRSRSRTLSLPRLMDFIQGHDALVLSANQIQGNIFSEIRNFRK